MKTYTRDEIKRIMIDRPNFIFVITQPSLKWDERYQYDESGNLYAYEIGKGWARSIRGLPDGVSYTIPADNEKPVELPESVRKAAKNCEWSALFEQHFIETFTALWAETVKLVEAGKK